MQVSDGLFTPGKFSKAGRRELSNLTVSLREILPRTRIAVEKTSRRGIAELVSRFTLPKLLMAELKAAQLSRKNSLHVAVALVAFVQRVTHTDGPDFCVNSANEPKKDSNCVDVVSGVLYFVLRLVDFAI